MRYLVFGALTVAALSATWFAYPLLTHSDHRHPTAVAQPDVDRRSEVSASEVARLRDDVARLGAQLSDLRGQATIARIETASTEPGAAAQAQTVEDERQQRKQYVASLEASFDHEPRDVTWSNSVMTEIHDALSSEVIGLAAKDFECRSLTCRIVLPADERMAKGLPMLVHLLGKSLPNTIIDQLDDNKGGTTTVVYLFRGDPPVL
ncbi:MAG TPA: hypothetical protein VJT73_03815 [Polyangiaceae bacterium]|nr:hypothetical protein [Polyangiaceae bacterium]